jgi:hypothetical protein
MPALGILIETVRNIGEPDESGETGPFAPQSIG